MTGVQVHTMVTRRRLTARHGELVVLLELHPEGIDARSLAELLYGEPGHETAVRAELHRLRAIVGEALRTRPYRLDGVGSDLAELRRCLDDGRHAAARELDRGPLLPGSKVPAIVRERTRLVARLQAHDPAAVD